MVWLEAHFRFMMTVRGQKPEIVVVLRDITQRKALEDQLSSAKRRLSQLREDRRSYRPRQPAQF